MVEIEVVCSPYPVEPKILDAVRDAAAELGLTVARDDSLATYPGSRHWHLRNPSVSGTLEVTSWPAGSRLWVSYHDNRVGDGWVRETAPLFAQEIGRRL